MLQDIHNISVAKAGKVFEVNVKALPNASMDFLINYGLKQLLNDATAPISLKATNKDGEALYADAGEVAQAAESAVTDKLARLAAGTIAIRSSEGRAPVDPVEAEFRAIVWNDILKPALVKKGTKLNTVTSEDRARLIAQVIERHPDKAEAARKEAKARLKKRDAVEVDLDI